MNILQAAFNTDCLTPYLKIPCCEEIQAVQISFQPLACNNCKQNTPCIVDKQVRYLLEIIRHGATKTDENMVAALYCPIKATPLYKAVTLIPCAHRMEQSVAERLFEKTKHSGSITPNTCPICRIPVEKFYPDLSYRNLAHTMYPKTINNSKYLYPGKGAIFVHDKGSFRIDYKQPRAFIINFKSITKNSTIESFYFSGFQDHSVGLTIVCAEKYFKQFKNYLLKLKFSLKERSTRTIAFTKKEEVQKAFEFLRQNNGIPDEYLVKMIAIISRGLWIPVPVFRK